MLLALTNDNQGIGGKLLRALDFHGPKTTKEIVALILSEGSSFSSHPEQKFSPSFKIMLALAGKGAKQLRDYYVGTHHVLFALTKREDLGSNFLKDHGIDEDALTRVFIALSEDAKLID